MREGHRATQIWARHLLALEDLGQEACGILCRWKGDHVEVKAACEGGERVKRVRGVVLRLEALVISTDDGSHHGGIEGLTELLAVDRTCGPMCAGIPNGVRVKTPLCETGWVHKPPLGANIGARIVTSPDENSMRCPSSLGGRVVERPARISPLTTASSSAVSDSKILTSSFPPSANCFGSTDATES